MDYAPLVNVVKKAAPLLGTALGGPVGGAVGAVSAHLLGAIASALGVDTTDPDELTSYIESNPDAVVKLRELEANTKVQLQQIIAQREKTAQDNLSDRHQADMASDSWLSKNVRPLVLIVITTAIVVGIYAQGVSDEAYRALCEMGQWVYGYYFVGRSAFDKGNIRLDWRRKP